MQDSNRLYLQGRELARQLFGHPDGDLADIPLNEGDDFRQELVTWVFGYLLKERSALPVKTKILGIVAMCTARGEHDMLRRWLTAARNSGCTRVEVQETILTMVIYGGWPEARTALEILSAEWPADGNQEAR